MLDARDAMLAADLMRDALDPAWPTNQGLIWNAFAKRGLGQAATTNTTEDDQPQARYDSPFAVEGTIRVTARDDSPGVRPLIKGTSTSASTRRAPRR